MGGHIIILGRPQGTIRGNVSGEEGEGGGCMLKKRTGGNIIGSEIRSDVKLIEILCLILRAESPMSAQPGATPWECRHR